MSLRLGMVIFQGNNPSFKWVDFATSCQPLRYFHEKLIKNHTETVYLEVYLCRMWDVAGEKSKDPMAFF